ncbi:MAG: hypothetical protein M1546_23075 [Chloroflexi bacterium]|nr:hypothetical protein [Chloroflexota bacterium]
MFSILTKRLALTVLAMAFAGLSLLIQPPQPAAAKVQSMTARACRNAIYASLEMDNSKDAAPGVGYVYQDQSGTLRVISSRPQPSGNDTHVIYEYFVRLGTSLPDGASGVITVDGAHTIGFTVQGECAGLGKVAGTAYLDSNANGRRDRGEPIFTAAWLKVTGGGVWYVCGWVGDDATYGVTVTPGTYYVMPVAPKGYRTTTPRIRAEVLDLGYVAGGTDMGFVKDPASEGDACDQYNPPRP